jgi:hypothetical protein
MMRKTINSERRLETPPGKPPILALFELSVIYRSEQEEARAMQHHHAAKRHVCSVLGFSLFDMDQGDELVEPCAFPTNLF